MFAKYTLIFAKIRVQWPRKRKTVCTAHCLRYDPIVPARSPLFFPRSKMSFAKPTFIFFNLISWFLNKELLIHGKVSVHLPQDTQYP